MPSRVRDPVNRGGSLRPPGVRSVSACHKRFPRSLGEIRLAKLTVRPGGGIGRRRGLKIPRPMALRGRVSSRVFCVWTSGGQMRWVEVTDTTGRVVWINAQNVAYVQDFQTYRAVHFV